MSEHVAYIGVEPSVQAKVDWVLSLLERNHGASIAEGRLSVGYDSGAGSIQLSERFYRDLEAGIYDHHHHMPNGPFVQLSDGSPDYLSTIFYLVNCLQEYNSTDLDQYGRFTFEKSLQKKWGIVTENKVWDYIQLFCDKHTIPYSKQPVQACYLSHDIDFIYRGWKREGLKAVQQGSLGKATDIVTSRFVGMPIFANIAEIAEMEASAGYASTFYWIASQQKREGGIDNADYSMTDPLVQQMMTTAEAMGCEHGMHKAAASSSFRAELEQFSRPIKSNRYHYLKFALPHAWAELDAAGIAVDCSLGFAEHFGYRNSYGLPFRPFDLEQNRTRDVLIVPLHIMDTTLTDYMNIPKEGVADIILDWVAAVQEHTLIGVLWHNTNLSRKVSAEMWTAYEALLTYMRANGFASKIPKELLAP